MDLLIDTSLLVDALRASPANAIFFIEAGRTFRPVIHPVVEGELIAGARDRSEQKHVSRLLARFETITLEPIDASLSLRLLRRHRLADGVSWEDCLLASSALRTGTQVATLNDKHFRVFRGLKLIRPY